MESSASLRPGVVLGSYPQRAEPRIGRLDRLASRAAGFVRQHFFKSTSARFSDITGSVRKAGEGLEDRSDEQLTSKLSDLRHDLAIDGLKDELVARSFAIVRELSHRTLGMRHFDVQIMGGWVMMQGMIAEMQTGEGKTLTATLPACTAALSGIPVHIITVNDYLVQRDAELMRPLYNRLGLTVGYITESMSAEERCDAYACDITYCTNKQLVFDYLKDQLAIGKSGGRLQLELKGLYGKKHDRRPTLLRGLCFAIIDEADSVLIDEARTPLIISRPGENKAQEAHYQQALAIAGELDTGADYTLRINERSVELTQKGKDKLREYAQTLGGVWLGSKRREDYIRQALSAIHLFTKDTHYLLKDDKVQIIDEYTGRVMPDRSWEQGLHQMVEAKEGCAISSQPETLARISYQSFFRRYLRMSGMTGTAREITGELWSVYRLGTITIPPNKPSRRLNQGGYVYPTAEAKWNALLEQVRELHHNERPILVGTRSVAASEHLSALLTQENLPHKVLNARQDLDEAEIIANAGLASCITVATNMAGRGTDICLEPTIAELGGLHVIASERHEAQRIDRQLFGRCGRQGDKGSFEYMVSLDDELIAGFYPAIFLSWLKAINGMNKPLARTFGEWLVVVAQWAAEQRHSHIRRSMLRSDEHMGNALAFSGRGE